MMSVLITIKISIGEPRDDINEKLREDTNDKYLSNLQKILHTIM